ncbi:MAG: hypothetical protein ACK5AO_10265 [bacterium]|jgi:hypothetical protein
MSSLIQESMLRFFYDELSPAEHAVFMLSIEHNQAMMEDFNMLRDGIEALGQLSYSPSKDTLRAISEYAGQSASH